MSPDPEAILAVLRQADQPLLGGDIGAALYPALDPPPELQEQLHALLYQMRDKGLLTAAWRGCALGLAVHWEPA